MKFLKMIIFDSRLNNFIKYIVYLKNKIIFLVEKNIQM